ncbi:MAG TPA: DNA gyrase subunit A [Saprospiraceae bacterium]|jgi:DNA gyrase subunit A|nr:MAG: DNA gyrase subunit alpha [Candidatus Parvibacillus calidus]MBX2936538.1 DNA gyrase subunit A [Saprospiraceae bacterium]MBX7178630.1 DNA gyrase subunit A [Saprospiraceae bacterium]MCB0590339.1 DNA gyrase subunit A [Saprospiraceae bacterium]MCO5282968.1 DNA gyrase subunit A [Saprospiraceae bacterium]
MSQDQRIVPINLDDEMKTAYIDYSMSVIVSRALPDVRDGMKPVHRRVLYGMDGLSLNYNKPHKKSARIVGEVLGKYHPHGDSSVYFTMVRMAQEWSMRYPLVDGQGNFGSMDGDSPAAMRYTEARFSRIAEELLRDIEKETVDFALNFDDTLEEPTVLPTRIPNLLINGASGIAVGMATNMLPHNLTEVIDGLIHFIEKGELSVDEMLTYIKGPDFPTGGIIYGTSGIREYFATGRGRIVVRGKAEIENSGNKETIIITEIPYQVNKADLVAKIAELVNEGKIPGISDTRDESDRNGLRVVVDVKRDAMASVVLSMLYKYTPLQTSFGVNNIALVKGRPMLLTLADMMRHFIEFRIEVIVRRAKFDLRKAEERAHILEGLLKALDHLDEVIALIRASKTVDDAHSGLVARFEFSDIQAKAILEMRLQRLTGLERQKIQDEYQELLKTIAYLKELLQSEQMQKDVVKGELIEIKEKFGDARRTEISHAEGDISIEDLIADEAVAITISHLGYIKRTSLDEYKPQKRGGRGSQGSKTRDSDFIEHMFVASNHNYLLLFTEQGRCFWLRVFEIPEASKVSTGRVIQNIINLPQDDRVKAYIPIKDLNDRDFLDNHYILFCTRKGTIKKTPVSDFSRPRSNGINAITIHDGDMLLEARLTNGDNEIILANRHGRAIRFNESKVRSMGRTAAGVRGMLLDGPDDGIVGMVCVNPNDMLVTIFVVSENGNGKRSALEDYRVTNRGGKGVKTMRISEKTGNLIAIKEVYEMDEMMITTKNGVIIRMAMEALRVMGRATQGVRVIKLDSGDRIADIAVIRESMLSDKTEEE